MYIQLFTGTHVELFSFIHTPYFTETYNHDIPDSTGCRLFVVAMGKHILCATGIHTSYVCHESLAAVGVAVMVFILK